MRRAGARSALQCARNGVRDRFKCARGIGFERAESEHGRACARDRRVPFVGGIAATSRGTRGRAGGSPALDLRRRAEYIYMILYILRTIYICIAQFQFCGMQGRSFVTRVGRIPWRYLDHFFHTRGGLPYGATEIINERAGSPFRAGSRRDQKAERDRMSSKARSDSDPRR
jgi:hypothetical protein